jgi:hypothetical protein
MRNRISAIAVFLALLVMGPIEGHSHTQELHRHSTREAFKLLRMSFPGTLGEMESYVGTTETVDPTGLDKSWGALTIVSGSWIEDEYDVVYYYGTGRRPDFEQDIPDFFYDVAGAFYDERKAFTSVTHFWDADGGPDRKTFLSDTIDSFYWSFFCENSLQKMRKYVNGDYPYRWRYTGPRRWDGCPIGEIAFAHDFQMRPLIDMYFGAGPIAAVRFQHVHTGKWFETNCPRFVGMVGGYLYEILGRMCHLLEDMSVPAHVHRNAHACEHGQYCDYYERNELRYHRWSAEEVYANGGRFINPYQRGVEDPLFFLMYFMNQITDHYASGKTHGDDNYDPTFPYLSDIIPTLGPPTRTWEINDGNCRAMHDVLLPYAIRATAGLLYWFAVETGQLPMPFEVSNRGFEDGLDSWNTYGDGVVEDTDGGSREGDTVVRIERDGATGRYFGLYQGDIVVEPDTEYRLSLRVKTNSTNGYAAAGLGVWSSDPSLNHHSDFGYVRGRGDWVHISGTWKSRSHENVIRVMLFGSPDFVGEAFFDDLVLEEIQPRNAGFERGLQYWEPYGDGDTYEAGRGGLEGFSSAHLAREEATGNYFGLVQREIPCQPATVYRLTLWVKNDAERGSLAAGLGNWGSPNTHRDFGWTGGHNGWRMISGTWTSRWDETSMDIVLYGTRDFSGEGYFDYLVLEKVGPVPLAVTITGPSSLEYKESGLYTAKVSGGSSDYRYQWYEKMDGNSSWRPLGRSQTQGRTLLNRGFTLKVEVYDIGRRAEGSATRHVEYEGDLYRKPVK